MGFLGRLFSWFRPEQADDAQDSGYPISAPSLTDDEHRHLHTTTQPIGNPGALDSDHGRLE